MSRRALFVGGAAIGGGAAYYFYQAGGDAGVAQKKAEHDMSKLSSTIKSELPGQGKELKKEGELTAKEAGARIDGALNSASGQLSQASKDAQKKLEEARKETGAGLNKAVDKFDKTVTEGASQSKSYISSWFGGK